jgi:hypothetical protein
MENIKQCFKAMKAVLDDRIQDQELLENFVSQYTTLEVLACLFNNMDEAYWEQELPRESVAPLVRATKKSGVFDSATRVFVEYMATLARDEEESIAKREVAFAAAFHFMDEASLPDFHIDVFRDLSGAWVRPMLRLADSGELFPKYALKAVLLTAQKASEDKEEAMAHFHAMLYLMETSRKRLGVSEECYSLMSDEFKQLLEDAGNEVRH